MNYLETGLPHTQFFPKKTFFSPPRSIPMSGLSRKYMGLEPLTRREIELITNRLSKPKKRLVEEDPIKVIRESRPTVTGTGRFVGQKRMSSVQIEKMVARLSNRKTTKCADLEDDMLEPNVVTTELGDDLEAIVQEEEVDDKQSVKPPFDRKNSILRKDSVAGIKATMNVSFQDTEVQLNISKFNFDISAKRGDSKTKHFTAFTRQSSGQKARDSKQNSDPKSPLRLDKFDIAKGGTVESLPNKKQEIPRSFSSDSLKSSVRPSTSGPQRSPKLMRREAPRPSTSESPRSPSQTRQTAAQKQDKRVPRISTSTPCDELLIDRVATYNRSPRAR